MRYLTFMFFILFASFGCNSKAVPVFNGVAYSPNEILVANEKDSYEISLIDPDGIVIPKETPLPLLWQHDQKKIVGHCETVFIDGEKRLQVSGVISQYNEMSKELRESIDGLINSQKYGFKYQLSVGGVTAGQTNAFKEIPFRQKITFYGKEYEGPLLLINKFVLREISIVPIGGSVETGIKIERK